MFSFLLNKEVKEGDVVPCYFLYGEETFLADQFVACLEEALISPEIQEYVVERFSLEDSSWAEVIDVARTIPFFLSPWRIVVVEALKGKKEDLSAQDQELLKAYFSSSPSKTVIVVIFPGKIRKGALLVSFFASFPSSVVFSKELKPLKERALYAWMDKKFSSQGKEVTHEAKLRLEEFAGADLRKLNSEIDKLNTYVGDKKVVDIDDVNQVSGWVKTFLEWEIADSLDKADFKQSLVVLNNLFKEGTKPEYILGSMARFFRDVFLAKTMLKEKDTDRKAIFRELKPQIQEKFGSFYATKFREFFSLVEKFSMGDLSHALTELEKIDLKIKTSGLSPQTMLESFLFDYCRFRKKERIT